jgi:hypothetical protein
LRILEGGPNPPEKVPPRTTLMRQGLDEAPPKTYSVHEEEVPRAGVGYPVVPPHPVDQWRSVCLARRAEADRPRRTN